MNLISSLHLYNKKNSELKRMKARLETIELKIENFDRVKATTISDMPKSFNSSHDISDIICEREQLHEEKKDLELKASLINQFLVDVHSRLDCLSYIDRYLLVKRHIDNMSNLMIHKKYNEEIDIIEMSSLRTKLYKLTKKIKKKTIK